MIGRLGSASVLVSAGLLLSACAGDSTGDGGAERGPLQVETGDGGGMGSRVPPGVATYWTTFGVTTLCSDVPIEMAVPTTTWENAEPEQFQWYLWRMPPEAPVNQDNRPIIASGGRPPRLFGERQTGTFERVDGPTEISVECRDGDRDRPPFVQLLLSVQAGARTAESVSVSIRYSADGADYEAVLDDWNYAACGTDDECG